MPTAYLHLNGTDYQLPDYLAKQPDQLRQLADKYGSFVKDHPGGTQTEEVVINGAPAPLVIDKAALVTAAVYVVGAEQIGPPHLL
jgi:hypothetical protein